MDGPYTTVQDFRGYPLTSGAASDTFIWGSALTEGSYSIRLIAKDFVSGGKSAIPKRKHYTLTSRVFGSALVLTPVAQPISGARQRSKLSRRQLICD